MKTISEMDTESFVGFLVFIGIAGLFLSIGIGVMANSGALACIILGMLFVVLAYLVMRRASA